MPCTPRWPPPIGSCRSVGAITFWWSKPTKRAFSNKRNTSSGKIFPPQLLEVNHGHGRIEWRGIAITTVTPEQMNFPHVAQVGRVDRIRVLNNGKQEVETVWIITSLSPDKADA